MRLFVSSYTAEWPDLLDGEPGAPLAIRETQSAAPPRPLAFVNASTSLRLPLSSNPPKIIIWFVARSKTAGVAILAVTGPLPGSSVQLRLIEPRGKLPDGLGTPTCCSDAEACTERR
jgi:hypothetical protein